MWAIAKKEFEGFFSSATGYFVISVYLILLGLTMWVFPDYSIISYPYATLDQLFTFSPGIFIFLIPAICMRAYAEERQMGTLEMLMTKPITTFQLVLGKFTGVMLLIVLAILPTLVYLYSVWQLGMPPGNIDTGEIAGSYIALLLLSGAFAAIGLVGSALTRNQLIAFLIGTFLCFLTYWGFDFLSRLPVFTGTFDVLLQDIGLEYHYNYLSRGVIDSRNVVYFLSVIFLFLLLNWLMLKKAVV